MTPEFRVESASDAQQMPKRVAFIKGRTSARVKSADAEMAMTIPNLGIREIIAFEVMVIVLALISLFFNAPLEWVANPQHTPNPAKAPWYFLGLQELLHYFPPVVAGVMLPGLVIVALIVIPYFRVNVHGKGLWEVSPKKTLTAIIIVVGAVSAILLMYQVYVMLVPTILVFAFMIIPYGLKTKSGVLGWLGSRPLSWWIMTWFVIVVAVLTTVGILFRGPEWSWVWPWKDIY